MIIYVPIKRAIDYRVSVQIDPHTDAVLTQGVKHSMNPFDEIALESALLQRDAGIVSELVVIAAGDESSDDVLRSALAMGANKAIRIAVNQTPSPYVFASLLEGLIKQSPCDCVMLGKQAIDDDCNQLAQILAAFLGWPQATCASSVSFTNNEITVVREVDGGLETVICDLPAVVSADLRLAKPRLPSLPAIMKAKSKPIQLMDPESLGVSLEESLSVSNYRLAPPRSGGQRLESVDSLMHLLGEKEVCV